MRFPPYPDFSYDLCPLMLNGRDIRVLELVHNDDPVIECRLVVEQGRKVGEDCSGKGQPYHALSWCWGPPPSPTSPHFIKILHRAENGSETPYAFPVSENLDHALHSMRKLRETPASSKPWITRIWIDLISMNQNDNTEKNNQVPMMSQIYGEAEMVFVWLGTAAADSQRALKFIKNEVLNLRNFDKLVTSSVNSEEWAALTNLMKREWFSRRWVIQEIALAKDAVLLCGDEHITWLDFADAVSLFSQVESKSRAVSGMMKKQEWTNHVPDFFGHIPAFSATRLVEETNNIFLPRGDRVKEPQLSLEYLVSGFTAFNSTQPRDTIYALLAIAKDTMPETQSRISGYETFKIDRAIQILQRMKFAREKYTVDYSQPISDVYVEFVKFAIKKAEKLDPSRALDIICRPWAPDPVLLASSPHRHNTVGHWRAIFADKASENVSEFCISKRPDGEGLDTLPSWIPSIKGVAHFKLGHGENSKIRRVNADSLVGLPPHRYYTASGKRVTAQTPRFEEGLTVGGAFPELNGTHYHSMIVEGFILDTVDEMAVYSQNGNIPESWHRMGARGERGEGKLPDVFWRTLVANRDPNGFNAHRSYPRLIKHALEDSEIGGTGSYADFETQKSIDKGDCEMAADVLRRIQAVIWNRSLMRTEKDRLGLVPKMAQKGDLICILYGCSVPVLLRKFEKTDEEVKNEGLQRAAKEAAAIEKIGRVWRDLRKRNMERREKAAEQRQRAEARRQMMEQTLTSTPRRGKRKRGTSSSTPNKRSVRSFTAPDDSPSVRARPSPLVTSPDATSEGEEEREFTPRPPRSRDGQIPSTKKQVETLKVNEKVFYQLIGECYVHGMMNGEAIELQASEPSMQRMLFEMR